MRVTQKRFTRRYDKDAEEGEAVMTKINIDGYGECNVVMEVFENTDIPHFHIKDKDENTLCCIHFYNPTYYRGHKNDKHIKLSKSECEELDKNLRSYFNIPALTSDETKWHFGNVMWEYWDNDTTNFVNYDESMQPDYTKLRKRIV